MNDKFLSKYYNKTPENKLEKLAKTYKANISGRMRSYKAFKVVSAYDNHTENYQFVDKIEYVDVHLPVDAINLVNDYNQETELRIYAHSQVKQSIYEQLGLDPDFIPLIRTQLFYGGRNSQLYITYGESFPLFRLESQEQGGITTGHMLERI